MRCCADFLAAGSHARFLAHALSHSDGYGYGYGDGDGDGDGDGGLRGAAFAAYRRVRGLVRLPAAAWRLALAVALVLLASACGVSAQSLPAIDAAPAAPAAEGLLDRLRAEVAARWGVDAAHVHLEWSSPEAAAALAQDAGFRMIGGGVDGIWYVDVDGAEGRATRLRLRTGIEMVLPLAARDLERGTTLTAADIAQEPSVVWSAPVRATDEVEAGWVTRRRIGRGELLGAPGVTRPDAVKPGDDVRIVYAHGPVELVLAGRAAGSGAIGERVAVRAETGKRLEGVIVAPGTVRVDSGVSRR